MKCPHCGKDIAEARGVLVVHTNDAITGMIREIASAEGAHVEQAKSGREALWLLARGTYSLAVVDVASSDPYAFELVPELKKVDGLQVMLLASVFDKTAYKRRPTSLYGADDYLEQHHLPDKLPVVLAKLSARQAPAELSEASLVQKREVLRRAAGEVIDTSVPITTPFTVDGEVARQALGNAAPEQLTLRARELARKLVLDISLYNADEFTAGIKAKDLGIRLQRPIEDAKRFLAERLPTPMTTKDAAAFIDEAVDELHAQGGR